MRHRKSETRARARAVQALYAWDLRGEGGARLDIVASQIWDDLAVGPEERAIAGRLLRVILERGAEIDDALREVTSNWRLERVGAVERAVLRLATAELIAGDTPPRVVIHEALRLAERYGSAQSARFVNGVADAIARRLGRL
ncbi:MAG TPA: transcription antitermination factor NusB [Gemmatimonadaceae bacterium]|nr:transcription antitermination factor NusB [Gemmatimonadaceae bacterium]